MVVTSKCLLKPVSESNPALKIKRPASTGCEPRFKKTEDGKKFYQEKRLGSSFARSVPPLGGSVGMMGTLRKEVFNREVIVHQWTMRCEAARLHYTYAEARTSSARSAGDRS